MIIKKKDRRLHFMVTEKRWFADRNEMRITAALMQQLY